MGIDILFIVPGNHQQTHQGLSKEYSAIGTPAWTALLASRARKNGHAAAIYDVNVEGWAEHTASALLGKYDPSLVVMMVYGHQPSASTETMPAAGRIARDLKRHNRDIPLATGGTHPSALPGRTLLEESTDFVIQGEGVYTIDGLLQHLKGKKDRDTVAGLWFRQGGEVCSTAPAAVVGDLDAELDDYAWDLLPDLSHYRAHNMYCFQDFERSKRDDFADVRSPYVAMNTSLGCPYSCHYCCINAIFGRPRIRYWSVEKAVAWIDQLVEDHGVRNIRFDDELFIASPRRVERLCDLLIERGHDLNIFAYARPNTIKPSLLTKLKKAGVNWISIGIESGNERVRADVNKNLKEDTRDVVRMIQAHGIYVLANFIFGLPEDDLSTMQETLELAITLNCESVNFYTAMAYPGSRLYSSLASEKGALPDRWEAYAQLGYETQPLPTKHLSAVQVLKFRDEAFHTYSSNERYLKMLEERFGLSVRRHIEKMLGTKIKRRLLEDQ